MKHDVIAMVGLPARGKTFISKSIVSYLNERGYECRIFNVGEYRRLSTDYSSHDFFSSNNEHALQLRTKFAIDALEDLCSWLAKGDNRVAIYDATNSTKDRREIIYDTVVCKYNYNLLFIESICNKPGILEVNIRHKTSSPDYSRYDKDYAIKDFKQRIAHYESRYRPLGCFPEENKYSFIQIMNAVVIWCGQESGQNFNYQQQANVVELSSGDEASTTQTNVLPLPLNQRPNVRVNIRDWTRLVSEDIRLVSNMTLCTNKIRQTFEDEAEFQLFDPTKARENILNQINGLLSQHKAAVNLIVAEAEKAAYAHTFVKDLRVTYTDVHRVKNELDASTNGFVGYAGQELTVGLNDYTTNQYGAGFGASDRPQYTSISGGTPVPGPAEWQTPIKSIAMHVNRNFGDIPVNTSMSAVHLPLPIYPGLPEIMNTIAWTERLDAIFRRNLVQYMHVHHQYYGDTLGLMRTFPAHKWRIARNEPDLFDARTRPWYIAGAATPKDVVVLVDTSGSMTGLRREIAKGVVFEILDTLTINDHFAVLRFSETVTPVGFPKCNLKTARLAPQLERMCPHTSGGSQQMQQSSLLSSSPSNAHAQLVAAKLLAPPPVSTSDARRDQTECANWRRQWDMRGQYLRDHPEVVVGKNGSYISDAEYKQSIVNVTLDIRDAYLLPATSRNIRYLKSNFSMPTAGIANFTRALMAAFELLQAYNRTNDLGSQCNQAIMLITDGAIRAQEEVFNRYNYPDATIRVFTYMIGREVGDIRPTKEMACRNRGYYARVINLGEVREQVQKYLPVMARPLVLAHNRPITWTNAYGDETYQVLTDWVLELKRRERARIMLAEERERLNEANSSEMINTELTGIMEYDEITQVDEVLRDRIICEDEENFPDGMEQSLEFEIDPLGYNDVACHWSTRRADLLLSVVKPVFDLRNTSLFFERFLSKNVWQEKEIHLRNARLLGVAAVDLRIADIIRAAPSHMLGPNGYAILLGQNGFVMHHPNYYALLEDPFDKQSKILKPYFSAVDLTHIEQVYHRNESDLMRRRDDEMKLIKLREACVKRASGLESFYVKRAIDCKRRPHIRLQSFYYGPIKDTPYSFMLALPQAYGLNRMSAKLALDKNSYNYLKLTEFDLWTAHPDYRYCERVPPGATPSLNVQTQLMLNDTLSTITQILNATAAGEEYEIEYDDLSAISGTTTTTTTSGSTTTTTTSNVRHTFTSTASSKLRFICDKELFPSLLFDAKATFDSFVSTSDDRRCHTDSSSTSESMRTKLTQIYGLEMSFVATRSGLTRARIFNESPRIKKLAKLFIARHDRAVDESWYSRTVDWNMRFSEDSTIISVSYNAYVRLIAKLRQRITQRARPVANDTRSNCDPSLSGELDHVDESNVGPQAVGAPMQDRTSEQPMQADALRNDEMLLVMQRDEQLAKDDKRQSINLVDESVVSDQQVVDSSSSSSSSSGTDEMIQIPKIDFASFSTFDFLDLLANSSVHVMATQSVIVGNAKSTKRKHGTPVAVTGHLYDYAVFARKFLNSTSLDIRTMAPLSTEQPALELVDICPSGECPTKCGIRNDSIDCLLVDNNGYIIVSEELHNIGRSLAQYDEQLMKSLVEKRVYHQVTLTDYQAICARPDANNEWQRQSGGNLNLYNQSTTYNSAASSSSSSSSSSGHARAHIELSFLKRLVANFASAIIWTITRLYGALLLHSANLSPDDLFASESLIGRLHQWQRAAILTVDAQSTTTQSLVSNQPLLALLPNKTYLRPCEKLLTLYETRPYDANKLYNDQPEYFVTKCGCSAWYVYDAVPKTNLIMLIVNSTSACRRCDLQPSAAGSTRSGAIAVTPLLEPNAPAHVQNARPSSNLDEDSSSTVRVQPEEQVCAMLERDAPLFVQKPASCLASHPDEASIHICGAGTRVLIPKIEHLFLILAIVYYFIVFVVGREQETFLLCL